MSAVIPRGPVARYTGIAITLHWVVAILLVVNVVLALIVDAIPADYIRPTIDMHKSLGITILGLVLLRVLWRFSHRPPAMPARYTPLERAGAHAAHAVLYLLILVMPISGWMHDSAWKESATHPMTLFGMIPWPRIGWIEHSDPARKEYLHTAFYAVHEYAAYALYALLALHIVGALKHQFWDREPELQRMMPGR